MLLAGLALALLMPLLVPGASTAGPQAGSPQAGPIPTPTAVSLTPDSRPAQDASQPGSTDEITWMGVVIALIILIPILIASRGKKIRPS